MPGMPLSESECRCLLCRSAADMPESEDGRPAAWADQVTATVREHGWMVAMIPGDEHSPGFAYTIGLRHSLGTPELAMFGLPIDVMHALLNDVGALIREGAPTADGSVVDGLLASGLPLTLRDVDSRWYRAFFGQAIRFHGAPFPVRQVVWPGRSGAFPWQDGFDEAWRERQPALWIPPGDHPPGSWTALVDDV